MKLHFFKTDTDKSQTAYKELTDIYDDVSFDDADVIVTIGGDGCMLRALHEVIDSGYDKPVYGMNRGSVGFLLNDYTKDNLTDRIASAQEVKIHPIRADVLRADGSKCHKLAVNEVSLIRETRQAVKLNIFVDNKMRMENLICDGVIASTPAGSTAYNLSVNGPIIPLEAAILSLVPISPFRPRRWRGALLSEKSRITIEVLDKQERPVSVAADFFEIRDIEKVDISCDKTKALSLLFDPEMNLEERIIKEQFVY